MSILAGVELPHETVRSSPIISTDNAIQYCDPNRVF
jgi:hypothetical protein